MAVNAELARRCVDLLNEIARADRELAAQLIYRRLPCNRAVAEHPSIQVIVDGETGDCAVGILGIFNGLCGAYDGGRLQGMGAVVAILDGDGRFTGIFGLNETEPPPPPPKK